MRSKGTDTVFTTRVNAEKHTTVHDIGVQLASDTPDKVAGILVEWALSVPEWDTKGQDWAKHCSAIANQMTVDECGTVAVMLEILATALRAQP